ncbi:MAG TPA: YWFCY domain-containing protein [Puia sp.]|jgi:TusA-related sulfurtransferase
MSHTGSDEQPLNRILDWVRVTSVLILLIHVYYYCQQSFVEWRLTSPVTDRILDSLIKAGLFISFHRSKWLALLLLTVSCMGGKGRKMERLQLKTPLVLLAAGLLVYFASCGILYLSFSAAFTTVVYGLLTFGGFILILTGESYLSRILRHRLRGDIFNCRNESFPQEERRLNNEESVNLPYSYELDGVQRRGWINIRTMRHLLLIGSPGSGKSWYIIQNVIRQQIEKGYAMFVFDFKYNDLTKIAYNAFLRHRRAYPSTAGFYVISFDDLDHSHRCNPLHISGMTDIADAGEAARSFLLGLNMSWIDKQGDFWSESAITFKTALIWYLRRYKDGLYCTMPHVMQLLQVEYGKLFSILQTEPQIKNYISSFVSAYKDDAMDTLNSQLSTLKISVARLSSPTLYYIMSGNDFTLDLNNPKAPKICCIGSSPQRSGIYGAVISLYAATINRLVNKKGGVKCSEVIDEFSSFYAHRINETMATSRSNKVGVTIAIQDVNQVQVNYGKSQADVILNIPANIICGQVGGESARFVSEKIGKNVQSRTSIQTNQHDVSFSQSEHLDAAMPASRIAKLSAGEFVGVVADDPETPIEYKAFHGKIIQDNNLLNKQQAAETELPVIRKVSQKDVDDNYLRICAEVDKLVEDELTRMLNTPELVSLVIVKN